MIVVDTSVFLDELFKFNQKRHDKARILFRLIEEKDVLIVVPRIFRIELIGQLVRRMEKAEATILKMLNGIFMLDKGKIEIDKVI